MLFALVCWRQAIRPW